MTLINPSRMRNSFGISDVDLDRIKCFLQGSVYCWVKNRKDEGFAARDLVGGENYDWNKTPLIPLYQKHIAAGKDPNDAVDEAGKDLGWILKLVLHEDKRSFESYDAGKAKGYRLKP
ncbi:MAG: hypothetical protein WGN25_13360 [Candidatus Electrothrix sp. GW3-4]|uniref:hypothetical protein n=1 Tax=Candidatus Electrothrix sp. GW3-4 TaxID=3126740 RepID=UPI0030CA8518